MFHQLITKLFNLDGKSFQFNWSAAATVASSVISGRASGRAADQAAAGQAAAREESARQFGITQEQVEPYREVGGRGLARYEELVNQERQGNLPDKFKFGAEEFNQYKDPGYEFRVDEGLRALDRRLARGGKRGAGVRSRALMDLGQNLASAEFGAARGRALQDYGAEVSREQSQYQRGYLDPMARAGQLAQTGLGATQNLASRRASYADRLGQYTTRESGIRAAGTLGRAGAISAGIGAIGRIYQNSSNQPDYSGMSDYGAYNDTGRGPVIAREGFTG